LKKSLFIQSLRALLTAVGIGVYADAIALPPEEGPPAPLTIGLSAKLHHETLLSLVETTADNGSGLTVASRPLRVVDSTDLASQADLVDVLDIDYHTAVQACDEQRLYPLPVHRLPPALDERNLQQDYSADTLQPCAVGHTISSTFMVFDSTQLRHQKPAISADFFDPESFPGRRAIPRDLTFVAEWALLASGIETDQLYATLDRPKQAWPLIRHALDALGDNILWIDKVDDGLAAVLSGQASLTISNSSEWLHARSEQYNRDSNWPLQIVWHGALNQLQMWAIPLESAQYETAWQLIREMTDPVTNGKYSSAAGNAPARQSSLRLMHYKTQLEMPSHIDNLRHAVLFNASWWKQHQRDYQRRFELWYDGLPQRYGDVKEARARPKSSREFISQGSQHPILKVRRN